MTVAADLRARVLDGPHRWGRLAVRPVDRTMWSTRTLVVYAPGTTTRGRVLLRLRASWPGVGALVGIAVMAGLVGSPVAGALGAVAVYGLGFAVLARVTRRLRPGVRSVTVTTFHGHGRPEVHGDAGLLRASLDTLVVAERALRAGALRPVDFEVIWADVWTALPERPPRSERPPRTERSPSTERSPRSASGRRRLSAGTPRAAGRRGPVD